MQETRQVAAPPVAGATQLPLSPSSACRLWPKPSVHVAPASSPEHAATPGDVAGRQASGPVPARPLPQIPGLVPPSWCSGRVHASPADFPEQASTTASGGA
jgi:hypothetical protein